jgi:hypothetical protein
VKPITINQPYKANGTAGRPVEEWIDMTPIQQAAAHLNVMRDTALKWTGVQWRESMGVPATVPADAQTLLRLCDQALAAIENDDSDAVLLAMKAAAQATELNRWAAIDKALTLQRKVNAPRSSGGKATAEQRKKQSESRCEEIATLWFKLQDKAEHERAGIIAQRLDINPKTVNRHLKKAGIR